MAAPVLTFNIDSLVSATNKADGTQLTAAEIGFNKLYKGFAATLNGSRAIKDDGINNFEWHVEDNTTANGRAGTYYAIRGTATVVKSGTPTPVVNDSFVRHGSTSSEPRIKMNLGDTHLGFSQQHGGGNAYQWSVTTSNTSPHAIPYGTAFEFVWLFKRDSVTAANQFFGFYVNGNLVCAADGLTVISTFDYTVRMWKWTHTAGLDFYLHGTLEVFDQDDLADIIRTPSGSDYLPARVHPTSSGTLEPAITRTPSAGVTYGFEPQSVGSGIDNGDSAVVVTGGIGDSETALYKPTATPAFGSDGSLTVTSHANAMTSGKSNDVTVDLQKSDGTNICSVQLQRDALGTSAIRTRIGNGSWSTLASSGTNVAHHHTVRFIQTNDGSVSVIVKDEDPPGSGGGNVWATTLATGVTEAARQVLVSSTFTAAGSAKRGSVEFAHRPVFDFYTDSWTAGTSTNPPSIQVANHFPRQIRGSWFGDRIPGIAQGESIGSTGYTVSGAVCFGTSGVSIAEWVSTVGPGLASHVRNQRVLMGISYMNTVIERASEINGSGYQTALDETRDAYVSAVNTLLGNKNTVIFVGALPPPVGVNYTQAQHDFVIELNAAIRTRLGQLTQPSGSALLWCDPYTAMGTTNYDALTWDGSDTHLGTDTDDATNRDWAWSSATRVSGPGGGRGGLMRLLRLGL